MFHHQREAIEAHLTVVFAALAVARHLQDATGTSIKKIVQALRTVRSATIEINGQRLILDPDLPTPPATSSRGSKQVTKRLARVRPDAGDDGCSVLCTGHPDVSIFGVLDPQERAQCGAAEAAQARRPRASAAAPVQFTSQDRIVVRLGHLAIMPCRSSASSSPLELGVPEVREQPVRTTPT